MAHKFGKSDLELVLFAMSEQLVELGANIRKLVEYLEALTDANKSIGFIHEKFMPIIQGFSEYMVTLPQLMNDLTLMSSDIRLFMANMKDIIENIDTKLDKVIKDG